MITCLCLNVVSFFIDVVLFVKTGDLLHAVNVFLSIVFGLICYYVIKLCYAPPYLR